MPGLFDFYCKNLWGCIGHDQVHGDVDIGVAGVDPGFEVFQVHEGVDFIQDGLVGENILGPLDFNGNPAGFYGGVPGTVAEPDGNGVDGLCSQAGLDGHGDNEHGLG